MTVSALSYSGYLPTCDKMEPTLAVRVKYQAVTLGACSGTLNATGTAINPAVTGIEATLSATGIYGANIPVTQKDYDTDLKNLLLNQYKTRS